MPRIADAPATYPTGCPHCHRVAGKPIAVSTISTPSSFTIELACSICHHRWAEVIARADVTEST
jgi:hypothetical protein